MKFTKDALPGLIDGSITVTFRAWTRAQVKVGGRYRMWDILVEVDDVQVIGADDITAADARLSGVATREAVLARLGEKASGPIWRIRFHFVGADDRIARRQDADLDDNRRAALQARLDRMDRTSASGPWTRTTLRLIATYPGVVSTALARQLNAERAAFKINVRKLKELGLTESLEVGYRLSPLGEAFLGADRTAADEPVRPRD